MPPRSPVAAERWLLRTEDLAEWPTVATDARSVGASGIGRPEHWEAAPEHPLDGTVLWRGALPGEGLVISQLSGADPSSELALWAEADLSMTGGCNPFLLPEDAAAVALEWIGQEDDREVDDRFKADETRAFQGLVTIETAHTELIRAYIVLVRRGKLAWNVSLQLSTACQPGVDADVVDSNDHARARAVLGRLAFDGS